MNITKNFQKWYDDFTCAICYRKLGYDIRYAEAEWEDEGGSEFAAGQGFVVVKCRHCGYHSVIVLEIAGTQYPISARNKLGLDYFLEFHPEVLHTDWSEGDTAAGFVIMVYQGQYPYGLVLKSDIPYQIKDDLIEAFNCLAINAPNASVLISRRIVQKIAINFGADEKTFLGTSLNTLKEKRLISIELYDALIEIKNWGDGGAHPGKFETIRLDEARKVAELVLILVKSVFPVKEDSKALVDKLKEIRKGKSR